MTTLVQHPGAILGHFIDYLLVPKKAAASKLRISRATLFRIIGEDGRITVDVAMRLERALHIPATYWLQRQMAFDIQQARRSGEYDDIKPVKSLAEARDALTLAENAVLSADVEATSNRVAPASTGWPGSRSAI